MAENTRAADPCGVAVWSWDGTLPCSCRPASGLVFYPSSMPQFGTIESPIFADLGSGVVLARAHG
ncbi:hypothetical protein LZA78_07830 [Sinirhodobacter sp. WL0062]|uniref:Uncharacterized protein n=1 Tax=Rhodobacter flavimaris TaxID=2907145 RepID=A0ABS8Z0B7_9RHOB|nr:hypothetical protein [Sinirhodobacter sp. WL0062]MCE5973385.1 hypothetical protein [Sinirhodobacter sp. WL0062]